MIFGAIDIGSNAVRLLLADVTEYDGYVHIKKLSLTRVPVRLGSTVFETGVISELKEERLSKTMKAFAYLMDVYEVKDHMVCATSAMREADNSAEVITRVKQSSGIEIDVIDGQREADLIFSTFETQDIDLTKTYLYIDVGGGSTEVTLLKGGKRVEARSFQIGTVRIMKRKVTEEAWEEMRAWVRKITANERDVIAIGTGGNINRMAKLDGLKFGEYMTLERLKRIHADIKVMSFKERVRKLRMRSDRADVVVPAGDIYLQILETAEIQNMSIPKVGLSDGMVLSLYHKHVAIQKN